MNKRWPKFRTDEEIEKFLEKDLSPYLNAENLGKASLVTFEFEPKDQTVTLRVSKPLLGSIRRAAKKRKMSYQKYMRQALEMAVRKDAA